MKYVLYTRKVVLLKT